jgi:hypothetical protein
VNQTAKILLLGALGLLVFCLAVFLMVLVPFVFELNGWSLGL